MGYFPQSSSLSDMKSIFVENSDENNEESAVCSYESWLENHPNALENFEEILSIANKGKEIVLFLDYDGTLSPIVEDPDQAHISDAMRTAVREVAFHFPTAIISGRQRNKVYEFVKLRNVYYAGSHGMDISTPLGSSNNQNQKHQTKVIDENGNQFVNFLPAKEYLSTIQEDVGVLKEIVESIMKAYPDFQISGGRKVMEIRPKINWDKGRALLYLLDTLGFDNFNHVLPIYIGDDKTDEDAFKVIVEKGEGFPIIVSSVAKETMASFSLRDPSHVMTFLIRLAKWKRNYSSFITKTKQS
ncbi:hypothetical protein Ahy_B02g057549 [Arachis hypogaea]|uniref:Trehalose 6-phosphate phosphatase n=1 Tax=Arachis hypogaea TaxID=3818 RepID=A0A445ACE6_ARAHY|nr:hypothetical protein Ahy_B02g057549 [Arachis hypogaea]